MGRLLPLLLLATCLTLSGCAATNEVEPGNAADVTGGQAIVIVGVGRAGPLRAYPFVIDIRGVEPRSDRIVTDSLDPQAPRLAKVTSVPQGWSAEAPRFQAFALEPGSYAITQIRPGDQAPPSVYMPRMGGGTTGGLIALGVVAAIGLAAIIANEVGNAASPSKSDTLYFEQDRVLPTAPRFDLRPGEVVYLGDVLFGTEARVFERIIQAPGAAGPSDNGPPERVPDNRVFAEYGQDVRSASAFAGSIGLGNRPFRTATLVLHEAGRSYGYIASYLPVEAVKGKLVAGPTVHRAAGAGTAVLAPPPPKPAPIEAATGPVDVARTPEPPPGAGTRDLMERFLDGEISKSEYERERARQASGS